MRAGLRSGASFTGILSTGQSPRWAKLGALALLFVGPGLLAADDDQVSWLKLDEARARSLATGKPILVMCMTDLLPDGPATKGIDRSFTSEQVRPQKDEFLFVKCTDMKTVRAVKATSKCELIVFDPDGDELHRTVVKSTQDIATAMKFALTRYVNRPIQWAANAPAPADRSSQDKKLTVVLFRNESDDAALVVSSLEDRSVAKLHPRCTFVAIEYRKGSPELARWNVLGAPTLILLDPEKEFGPKAAIDRTSGRKNPREARAFLRKGLAEIERSHR